MAANFPLRGILFLCGMLSPAIYVGADILAARLYPGFRYTDQAVSELLAIGSVAEAENTAPPRRAISFLLTQTRLFMSIMIEFWPVANTSP